jgi:hypothetical protein
VKPRARACAICATPAIEGRVLCAACLDEYDRSPEHARAACALSDFVDRVRAERRQTAPAKLSPATVKSWGAAAPTSAGYRPPDPEKE